MPRPHPPRHAVPVLLGTLLAVLLVVLGVGWLLTHPLASSVGGADDDLARWLAAHRTPDLSRVADVGTLLGETPVGAGLLVLVGAVVGLVVRSWRPLLFVVVMYAGMGVVYFVATHVDHRDRPPVRILDAGLVPDRSFPSGHVGTATAVALCTGLLLLAYRLVAARWLVVVTVLLAVVPLLTLSARLYQGAHHLTDVLTSVGYATVWALAVAGQLLPDRRLARERLGGLGRGGHVAPSP